MSTQSCPDCAKTTDGLCPRCLAAGLFTDESDHFELPESLGGFLVKKRIGRGASGEVWLAFQPGPDREVALKVFLDPRLGGVADRTRFLAEAKALGKLDHPAILPVYATGEEAGYLFIASPWMPGRTLAERQQKGIAPPDQHRAIVGTMLSVTRAVAHAHRHGLVHRDIKPANVLLGPSGEPYLADFGIAVNEGEQEENSTSGTPAYMAPEQARGESVTTSADLYSLGALLVDLLTGKPPETGRPDLKGMHPDLVAICLKCLQDDPSQRYSSANDLADDFEHWLAGEPVNARPVGPAVRLKKWARRKPGIAILAGATLATAIILLGTLIVGSDALRKERNHAVSQEQIARASERETAQIANSFQLHSYAADMYAVGSAIQEGQRGLARRILDRHLPAEGRKDIRDYAWHTYQAMMEGDESRSFHDHSNSITSVAFSPDGQHFASAGFDGQIIVRSLTTFEPILTLPKPDAPTGGFEIPIMTKVALRSPEIREQLLSTHLSPDEVRMRGRPSRLGEIDTLVWSPDGQTLVSAGGGSYLRFWSFPEGKLIGILPFISVRSVYFSEDGQHLAFVCVNSSRKLALHIHNTQTLEPVFQQPSIEPGFAVHGNHIAYVRNPGLTMVVTTFENPDRETTWHAGMTLSKLAFSQNNERLLGLDYKGREIALWQTRSGTLLSREHAQGEAYRSLISIPGGFAMAGSHQKIDFYTNDALLKPKTSLRGHQDEILTLSISPDGQRLLSAGKDRSVRLWDMPGSSPNEFQNAAAFPPLKCHSPNAQHFLAKTGNGTLCIGTSGEPLKHLDDGIPRNALSFHPTEDRAATWRQNDENLIIEWWSIPEGLKLSQSSIPLSFRDPAKVAANPLRTNFAVTAESQPTYFYDLESLTPKGELPPTGKGSFRLSLSPDGQKIARIDWPRYIRVGELGKGWNQRFKPTRGNLGPVIFSNDGNWLISGNDENLIAIHDAQTSELIQTLTGHYQRVVSLTLSPDGRTLASSSDDLTLRIWHLPTWRELGVLDNGTSKFYLGFDDQSRHLCAGYWGLHGSAVATFPRRLTPPAEKN
ncbi:MAG: protein kinase domain-containing protein [Verrucomicrobiaceae bacterium]